MKGYLDHHRGTLNNAQKATRSVHDEHVVTWILFSYKKAKVRKATRRMPKQWIENAFKGW